LARAGRGAGSSSTFSQTDIKRFANTFKSFGSLAPPITIHPQIQTT
jgi:hypothetical protein